MPAPLPVRQPIIVEHRRKSTAGKPRGKVNENAGRNLLDPSLHFSNIAELVAYGDITVGVLHPIGCVATPCDEDSTLVMLVRRNNESLIQFPTRLDQAMAKAYNEGVFTDEINPPL
jgi:hypothetical protein